MNKIQRAKPKLIYDNDCSFCRDSVRAIKVIDLWNKLDYVPGPGDLSEMKLEFPNGKSYGGFFAFRQLIWLLPVLYPMLIIFYFPGSSILGPKVYRWVAGRRKCRI